MKAMRFLVEHMEEEVFEWCLLEYQHMLENVGAGNLVITNVPSAEICRFRNLQPGIQVSSQPLQQYIDENSIKRSVLLDQCADMELTPKDALDIEFVICGGILGTDEFDGPVVDRTGEIRARFSGKCRTLGPKQMTADTALIVSKMILIEGKELKDINFIDKPSLKIRRNEYVEMPFRYIANGQNPIIPRGMLEYLKQNDDMI